jgi:hypothetical protein
MNAYQDIKDGKTDHEKSAYRDIKKPKETETRSDSDKKSDSDSAWSDGTKSRGFSK